MDPALLLSIFGLSLDLPRFLLVLVRVSSLFVIAPIFGNTQVPVRFRIALAVFISFFLLPATAPVSLPDAYTVLSAVFREFSIGIIMGFFAQLIFFAIQLAGHMVATQMGFGLERILDPTTHTPASAVGQIYLFTGLLTFLAIDGHHLLLLALARTFHQLPLGSFSFAPVHLDRMLEATNGIFVSAFVLMLPALGLLLLVEVSLAIATRVMPQLNAMVMGFPIKIFLGIITLMITLPLLSSTFEHMTGEMVGALFRFFR